MCEVTVDSSHVEEMVDVDDAAQEGAAVLKKAMVLLSQALPGTVECGW